ncbi:MAG: DUF2726 domain-containing protein [Clostridiales Family XIII bacterium]|nr:DUF2726 domain-containing protein [Clostridiales Family XIII bacterium]
MGNNETEIVIICILAIMALIILKVIIDTASANKAMSKANSFGYDYETKPLMTQSEISFYNKLKTLESDKIHIFPQVNLAAILNKKGKYTYQTELFRNIDFGIFDESYNPEFLIELNDKSHERKDRQNRDEKVKTICIRAGIDLIIINTNNPDIEIVKSYIKKKHAGILE